MMRSFTSICMSWSVSYRVFIRAYSAVKQSTVCGDLLGCDFLCPELVKFLCLVSVLHVGIVVPLWTIGLYGNASMKS